ncbi:hypothetical protein BJ165DRAFT_101874 [Panaeolus papilionaceus]|nr:hypothetical protein BJ165DRAFT_101874 [Panaeolus papilionaceus]
MYTLPRCQEYKIYYLAAGQHYLNCNSELIHSPSQAITPYPKLLFRSIFVEADTSIYHDELCALKMSSGVCHQNGGTQCHRLVLGSLPVAVPLSNPRNIYVQATSPSFKTRKTVMFEFDRVLGIYVTRQGAKRGNNVLLIIAQYSRVTFFPIVPSIVCINFEFPALLCKPTGFSRTSCLDVCATRRMNTDVLPCNKCHMPDFTYINFYTWNKLMPNFENSKLLTGSPVYELLSCLLVKQF